MTSASNAPISLSEFSYRKGSEIYGEKEPAEYVYQVKSGAVRSYKLLSDGRRQIGAFHLAGDIFGLENGSEHRFTAEAIVNTIFMNADDMKEAGIVADSKVLVRSEVGEAVFTCKEGKVPRDLIFVAYGPPTCKLMGQTTDGTGMPTSKGWEVEVVPYTN